jgi:hypothetical protein
MAKNRVSTITFSEVLLISLVVGGVVLWGMGAFQDDSALKAQLDSDAYVNHRLVIAKDAKIKSLTKELEALKGELAGVKSDINSASAKLENLTAAPAEAAAPAPAAY